MDQQDKNWLELGHRLENYQPEGDPASDFNVVQQLQKQARKRKRSILGLFFASLCIVGVVLVLSWLPPPGALPERPAYSADQLIELESENKQEEGNEKKKEGTPENDFAARAPVGPPQESKTRPPNVATVAHPLGEQISSSLAFPPTSELTKSLTVRPEEKLKTLVTNPPTQEADRKSQEITVPSLQPVAAKEERSDESVLPAADVTDNQPPTQPERLTATPPRIVVPLDREPFTLAEVKPELLAPDAEQVIVATPSPVTFSLGAGLSNHWRGANFWQEVDRGVYAYIGLQRRFGNRLNLEGRIGYRGHTMQLPIIRDTDKPWSYHEEEVHSPDHTGTIQAYTYQGVVKGYRAVEFSLLANYLLGNRWQLSVGARYALPALEVHRTVKGPDDVNPFQEFIEGTSLVKYVDYGGLMGVNYRFNKHLQLETSLHLGMVDLINDTAEGMERFNHSSSISIGVKYLLE